MKPILIAESPLEPLHAVAVSATAARSGMSLRTGGLLMWGAAAGQAGRTTRTSPDPDLAWCPRPARGPSHREDSTKLCLFMTAVNNLPNIGANRRTGRARHVGTPARQEANG